MTTELAFRTIIVPSGPMTILAQDICEGLAGPSGAGMFKTELCSTANTELSTHTISSGPIGAGFAECLPLTSVDSEGIINTRPGNLPVIMYLLAQKELPFTQEQIIDLLAVIDVSEQGPFVAQARLGLEMKRGTLP